MGDRARSGRLVGTAGPALRGVTSIPGGVCGAVFIVKVEERKAAGMKSIADVRDEVEQMLKNLEKERLRKQWIAKLRKKSFVAYY